MAEPSHRTADVAIIGGGIIGCTIALRLAQARLRVMVLERGEIGGEASSAAAGMIAPQGEMVNFDAYFDLCVASRKLYPGFIAEIESASGELVGYRREGVLMVAADDAQSSELETIYQSQSRQGLKLERLTPDSVHRLVAGLSPGIQWGLLMPEDHWVNNRRLTPAVAKAAERLGVTFSTQSPVTKVNTRGGRVESVEAGFKVSAGRFILAAGPWSAGLVQVLGVNLPTQPCRGQMLEFESSCELPLVVRAGHHYLVPRSPRRVLVGTTAEYAGFEKEVTGEGVRSILEGASRIAPLVKEMKFQRAWAGLRPDTADHLPILGYGEVQDLVFATGHFRNGILLAPITAQLISELLVTGSTSRSIDAYQPARFQKREKASASIS